MCSKSFQKVPKLKGRNNYREWAAAVENALISQGTVAFIHEKSNKNPNLAAKDAEIKAKLILTIDPSLHNHLKDATTVRNLWIKIKDMFDKPGSSKKIALLRKLISIRPENCKSMKIYVTSVIKTAQKLSECGLKVNDEWVGCLLLAGLPEKYFRVIREIENSGIDITTDVVMAKLIDSNDDDNDGELASALSAKGEHLRQQSKHVKSGSNKYTPKSHNAADCDVESDLAKVNYYINQFGHIQNQCLQKNQKAKAYNTSSCSPVFFSGKFDNLGWYLDSEANYHITTDQKIIQNKSLTPSIKEIVAPNQNAIPVISSGEVHIITVTPDGKCHVIMTDVLCVPSFTTNLVSVRQLTKSDNTVEFNEKFCYVYNVEKKLTAVAYLVEGVYKLVVESAQCPLVPSIVWHRRLAHANIDEMNEIKTGLVNGIFYTDNTVIGRDTCDTCRAVVLSTIDSSRIKLRNGEALDIVHARISERIHPPSVEGATHFIIYIDIATCMIFIYFVKTKIEVYETFKEFKTTVEYRQKKKIKTFCTDDDFIEFCDDTFVGYLQKHGIIYQKTKRHTIKEHRSDCVLQCGEMEAIIQRSCCLLYDANLDATLWAEATNTAVYLRNRSVPSGDGKTAYELWTNQKPDLSHIRILGSMVVPQEAEEKLQAKQYILVGYTEKGKGYRIYDPKEGRVTKCYKAIIHENTE